MYQASAVKVMIASPSDVAPERDAARDVLREWNVIHSEDKKIVLMPIGWETHARPTMGERPQAIINKQVLEGCDVLVAMFWTRIGSPTGTAVSGTVEEIHEHVAAGKPTMIYFSSAPVVPGNIDQAQWQALVGFRTWCEERGLVETYESLADFRQKLARQIAQLVIDKFRVEGIGEGPKDEAIQFALEQLARTQNPIFTQLTKEARELLVEAAKDKSGVLMRLRTFGGTFVQTNGRQFSEAGNSRSEALWEGALDQLRENGLVQDAGHKGEVFRLTNRGYEIADLLQAGAESH